MIITKKYKYSPEEKFFIFYFPLINILFYSTVSFFPKKYDIDIIRGLFSFIAITYFLTHRGLRLDKLGKILLIFTVYVSIMSFVTYYNFGYLDKVIFKIITASFFYFFAIAYVRDYKNFMLMLKSFYYGLIIVLLSIMIANLFKIGPRDVYGMDLNLGAQGANTSKILPILFFPLILKISSFRFNIRQRNIYYFIIVMSTFVILFGLKRGTVLGLSLAFIAYLFLSGRKGKSIRMLITLSIFFIIFSTILWSKVERAYNVRSERYKIANEDTYEREARYNEMMRTLGNISLDHVTTAIFGYGFKSEFFVYHVHRMFHTDYMALLHGTGILGLFLYLWFYYVLFRKNIKKIPPGQKYYRIIKEIQAINIALIVYLLSVAVSGAIHIIDLRGFAFLFWAGSMRFQYSLMKQKVNLKRNQLATETILLNHNG